MKKTITQEHVNEVIISSIYSPTSACLNCVMYNYILAGAWLSMKGHLDAHFC